MLAETLQKPEIELPKDIQITLGEVALDVKSDLKTDNFDASIKRVAEITPASAYTPESVASEYKLKPEQAEAAVTNGEAMIPELRVAVRMPRFAFESLLSGEPYKTAFDSGFSRGQGESVKEGSDYLYMRQKLESDLGIHEGDEAHPVYGFLTDGSEYDKTAMFYGRLAVILKPEVTKRSTFTRGDSLGGSFASAPSLLNERDAAIANEALRIKKYSHQDNNPRKDKYVEAQIAGGLTLDDVDTISVDMGYEPDRHEGLSRELCWRDPADIETLIKQVKNTGKPISIEVRLDATKGLSAETLQLAKDHPEVKFIAVINPKSYDRNTELPFANSFMTEIFRSQPSNQRYGEELAKRTGEVYNQSKARREELKVKLAAYWQAQGLKQDEAPQNINLIIND